jgi:streptogramin lyase
MKGGCKHGDHGAEGGRESRKRRRSMLFGVEGSESVRLERRAMLTLSVASFSIPLIGIVEPQGITTGPDENLWFTESGAGAIGRMTVGGVLTQFTLPDIPAPAGSPTGTSSTPAQPEAITVGPDGALWFTTENSLVGRITTDGTITEYKVSGLTASTSSIVAGPDGALWFTGVTGEVGRITTAGVVTEFALPEVPPPAGSGAGTASTPATATGITVGPDGALWFAGVPGEVGRISTAGVVTEFAVPEIPPTAGSSSTVGTVVTPDAITAGPDGALWFTGMPGEIGRITTAGVVTEFEMPVPTSPNSPQVSQGVAYAITVGPDGALWFINENGDIGRITTTGDSTEFAVPGNFDHIAGLTLGPNGNLWFSETEDGTTAGEQPAVGEITAAGVAKLFPIPQGTTLNPSQGVDANPGAITTGPDGALWFTENGAIGRITTGGTIQQFPLTTPGALAQDITSGPDGAVWFTQEGNNSESTPTWSIGRITTSGVITLYPLPAGTSIAGITGGPGGKVWFTEAYTNPDTYKTQAKVGWLTPEGQIKTFRLPSKNERTGILGNITTGPNGELWFLDCWGGGSGHTTPGAVGSITAHGHIRMYQFVESESSGSYAPDFPNDLIGGPSGKLWFFGEFNNKWGIAKISTSGKLGSTIPTTGQFASAGDMVNSGDGEVWFELTDFNSQSGLGLATRSGVMVAQDLPGISLANYSDQGEYGGTTGSTMTPGPDGNLWATNGPSSILRISGLNTLAGGLDSLLGRQRELYFPSDGYATVTETAHPTFAGVASPGAGVTLWVQKQGESQPVSIGTVRATGNDGTWTLKSHVKLTNGNYAVTATQNGDTGSPSVLYSLQPDSMGNLTNALVVDLSRAEKGKSGKSS